MNELYAICQTGEIEDGDATGFVLMRIEETGERKPWPILITRKGNNFYGFENACPHKGERLDSEAGHFLDEEGNSSPAAIIRRSSISTRDTASSVPARARRCNPFKSSLTTATSALPVWNLPRRTGSVSKSRTRLPKS
jgi:nitrite reductase/ring-hydroxylating ferredoxin subunit